MNFYDKLMLGFFISMLISAFILIFQGELLLMFAALTVAYFSWEELTRDEQQ